MTTLLLSEDLQLVHDKETGASARETGASARETGAGARETGASARETGASARETGASARETGTGARETGLGGLGQGRGAFMPSHVFVGQGPHRPSSSVDTRSHPHSPHPTRAGGVGVGVGTVGVGWDAIVKGVSMSRVATKSRAGTVVRGLGSVGVEARRLCEANECVRCVPTVCLLSCVFTPSIQAAEGVDARAARAADEAAAARGKSAAKSRQGRPPVKPPVKPTQASPPPLATLRCTFVSWRDAGYWCQWGDHVSGVDNNNDGGAEGAEGTEGGRRASSNSSVYSAMARSDVGVVSTTARANAFGGGGVGDSFYNNNNSNTTTTARNKANLGDSEQDRERRFSGRGLGDSIDSGDDFHGTPLHHHPLSPHNLATRSNDSIGSFIHYPTAAPPDPFSRLDVEKRHRAGVLALDQAGNRLTWLGRDMQAVVLSHTVAAAEGTVQHRDRATRDDQHRDRATRDDHDADQTWQRRQSDRQSEMEEEGGDRRLQRSAQRHSWLLPLPAAALWTTTAPAPTLSSTPPSSSSSSSSSSLPPPPPVVTSPVGPSFALFAVAALAIDIDRAPGTAPKARRIGPYLRAGGGLCLVLSMADDPSLSFLTMDQRRDGQDVGGGDGHGQAQGQGGGGKGGGGGGQGKGKGGGGGGGGGRVFPLLPHERPLQVEWQWLPSPSPSPSSPAVALLGVLTNQRVLLLAASSHGLQPLNAHTHTHTHRSHYHHSSSPPPHPSHHPHPHPTSWGEMRCGRWQDPASSIAWMGAALLFTTRSGAVQYLLPAAPTPPRPAPTSSRSSCPLISDHGSDSSAADRCVALALGFLPALTSAATSHNSPVVGLDRRAPGGRAAAARGGGGRMTVIDMSAGGGMDNTGLHTNPPLSY